MYNKSFLSHQFPSRKNKKKIVIYKDFRAQNRPVAKVTNVHSGVGKRLPIKRKYTTIFCRLGHHNVTFQRASPMVTQFKNSQLILKNQYDNAVHIGRCLEAYLNLISETNRKPQ